MDPFIRHSGVVMPLDRPNVDTDAIIPKQYLKSIRRTGFGPYLFDDWRYLDEGDLGTDLSTRRRNESFVMNLPRYAGASILLARENFGCGSSREHAVWALKDAGFRAVVAPGYADIFHSNCFKNGVLPVTLDASAIDALFEAVEASEGYSLEIDLEANELRTADGQTHAFNIDGFRRDCLLQGLDEIGLTLMHADTIRAFEDARRESKPWLFGIDRLSTGSQSGNQESD